MTGDDVPEEVFSGAATKLTMGLRPLDMATWLDADPDAVIAGHGRVADLVAHVDTSGVRMTDLALVVDRQPGSPA